MSRYRLLLLRLLLVFEGFLTLPQRAPAQVPRGEPGRFEVFGMDWPRNSAWRRRARLVRDQRWALLRAGDIGALNSGALLAPGPQQRIAANASAVTGTFYVPVIPLAFKDAALPFPISGAAGGEDYEDVLFASIPPLGRPYTV